MAGLYQNAYRDTLDTDDDIQALEAERNKQSNPEPEPKELDAEEQTFKKRYSDLRSYQAKRDKEWQDKYDDLKRQLEATTKQQIQLPTSEDELMQWKEEYPQVFNVMKTIAMKEAEERFKEAEERLKEVDKIKHQTAAERAVLELQRLHPDYHEIGKDAKFHEWLSQQDQELQDDVYNNDTNAKKCARVITLYKYEMGITTKKASPKREESASMVRGSRTPEVSEGKDTGKIKESWIASLTAREYERHEAEIDKARRERRIIYDLSGGAM